MKTIDVYEDLKAKISKEEFLPGEILVERDLCEIYKISRTPIREVLWKLVSDGLIEKVSNKGYRVKELTLENIFEIFQARESIEGMAVRLACQKGDSDFLSKIKQLQDELEKVDISADTGHGVSIGKKLHFLTVKSSNNSLLLEFYQKLRNLTSLTSNITKKSTAIEIAAKESHLAIMEAILTRDADLAEQKVREHLRKVCKQIMHFFYPQL